MPARHYRTEVNAGGIVGAGHYMIGVGKEHAGRPADILLENGHANVFIDGLLVRHLTIDTTRRYQPTGRPRGGNMKRRRLP